MAYVPVTLNPMSAEPSTIGMRIPAALVATAVPAQSRIKRSPERMSRPAPQTTNKKFTATAFNKVRFNAESESVPARPER